MNNNYQLKEKVLHTNNKYFKYVSEGQGPLLLLVHGWPETLYSWRKNIKAICGLGYKVVGFNCRGYSDSFTPKKVTDYAIKQYINDILDIMNYFEAAKVILVGHDWGAPICWNMAALYPEKVTAVVGMSVPYFGRGKISSVQIWKELYKNTFFYQNYFQEVGIAEKELEKDIKESITKIYYWISAEGFKNNIKTSNNKNSGLLDGLTYPTKPMNWLSNTDIEYLCNEFKKSGFRGPLNRYRNQHKDWIDLPELSNLKISSPSLFIGGEYDPVRYFIKNYDSYKNPGKLCSNFFGAHIVKDCGHWVQQEKPEQVNGIIKNFLEKIS